MSISAGTPVARPMVLHCENTGGKIRIVPDDNSVMAISVEMAIEACRAFKQPIVFKDQFDQLLHRLAKWISERQAKIADAYLTVRDSGLWFLVVQKEKSCDRELDEALTELDLEVANDDDFNLISLAVHAIPHSSDSTVQSFVSRKMELRYRFDAK